MKLKRSSRLVDMTHYLLTHPHELVSLTFFSERYGSAKSSISEDLVIIKESFETQGIGMLMTVPGASGGVKFLPFIKRETAEQFLSTLITKLSSKDRLLPGGYLYMTDILGDPLTVNEIGRLIASAFFHQSIDVIMTMETKGIPLAYATASQLNVPVIIVRRSSKVTEGSTVSINYVSGSSKRIQSMVLPRRGLQSGAKVLVIDDFMKAGGTMKGMENLINEFDAELVGCAVLVETKEVSPKLVNDYLSLLKLNEIDDSGEIAVGIGNYFNYFKEAHHE
ncbi:Pur operon repressor [Pullulanibacillus camelliae]|uniref:Pur operon repressor n=1 Tax=Pullulanibacillus camelliae TaxID=1707096 RepID=A0A8J2YMW6_9BACL|nr:pur operon repressor [Pullulanibacillus camelliae]GGE53991.1 Pur operon repressor [Pullulanibacillus camelliae]